MIWTLVQIALSNSIGGTIESILTPIGYASGVALADALTGGDLQTIGKVLHYPEQVMYRSIGFVLEQTKEVVDEINETSINLLDDLYSQIYE